MHEPAHPGPPDGVDHPGGAADVELVRLGTRCAHRRGEVEDALAAVHRAHQGLAVREVGAHELHTVGQDVRARRVAHDGAHRVAPCVQQRDHGRPDEARGARDEEHRGIVARTDHG